MNILPLVLAFIVVFTMCASLFMEEKKSTLIEEKHYASYWFMERKLRNRLEKKQFVKATPRAKKEEKEEPKKLKKDLEYVSHRQTSYPSEGAKLNIHLLIETPEPHLYEAAATLIRSLYTQKAKNFEYQILDTILEEAKQKKEKFSFASLPFPEIVKGTTYYDLVTKEGYPPLQDYLRIDPKVKPVNFYYAAIPVLQALLGDETAKNILAAEKTKWEKDHKHHTVTKEELLDYKVPLPIQDLCNFSKFTSPKKEEVLTDSRTKITLKR